MSLFDAPPAALTVTGLNRRVQALLEGAPDLQDVRLVAELSGFKRHSSGHLYFTLKDAESQLSAVMWRTTAARNPFADFADGDRVQVRGRVQVYTVRGNYQLQVERMVPDGVGELYRKLELLKAKLLAEGLFDAERKRPLPPRPRTVAVITSPTGAVVQDIIRTLRNRGVALRLLVVPAAVQGAEAVPSLLAAFKLVARLPVEVVVLARGGGSIEDLWCFNDETVARAIAACAVPVISAVGHETDFTVADLVADHRAATPTAAATDLAPDRPTLQSELAYYTEQLTSELAHQLSDQRRTLDDWSSTLTLALQDGLAERRDILQLLTRTLRTGIQMQRRAAQAELATHTALLASLNPKGVLERGYTRTEKDGTWLKSATAVHLGDTLEIYFADGKRQVKAEG